MSDLKKPVLDFLRNLPESPFEQFNKAFELYRNSKRKNKINEASYNRRGYSEQGLKNLLYDLKKAYEITDVDILSAKLEENPLFIDTYINNIEIYKTPLDTTGKVLKLDTVVDSETETSLRAEFPFLNNPDCPQILYVVVGKRIATYNKHKELHAKLQEINEGKIVVTPEELKDITADCDFAFSENRALWDELNHYATTNEILGKHPIFFEENTKKEVEKMTNEQLFKYINATSKFFTEQKKQLEKHKDDAAKIAEINTKIEERKYKLFLVKAKAGVVDAGEKK